MWSQPTPTNARFRPGFVTSLAPADWVLLVRLPPRVLASVLAVPIDPPPVSAGLAGLAKIAHARSSAGLVREVALAIFASAGPPGGSSSPVADECVRAGFVLAQRVPSAEAEAYRHWVRQIGEAAVGPEFDEPASASQISLLDDYARSLAA